MYNLSFLGLFSTIMRDLASINNDSPKWIVLDGDIDPMWIESLNTVMDDNKVTKCFSSEMLLLKCSALCFTLIRFLVGLCKAGTLNDKIIGFLKKSKRLFKGKR